MRFKNLLILGTILTCTSCATEYVTPKIPIPEEPLYPTVKAEEYQCMELDAKLRLQVLIVEKNNAIEECHAVLKPYQ